MNIVLFAMIGAAIKAGAWYWVCFAIYCLAKVKQLFDDIIADTVAKSIVDEIKTKTEPQKINHDSLCETETYKVGD